MRYFLGLLLLFTVLLDFTATCLADDASMVEACHISQEFTKAECPANEDERSHSDHSSKKTGNHCHFGHTHMALLQLNISPTTFTPERLHSSFSEVNLFIPSSFLKVFTRPPITA